MLPGLPVLRTLLGKHPAYRLVVEYLHRFTVEAAGCCRHLAPSIRKAMDEWISTVEHQKRSARIRAAVFGERQPSGQPLAQPRPLSIVLGWVLMTLDNLATARKPEVRAVATDVIKRRNTQDILRWSYVPRVVIGLLDVRLGEAAERPGQANAVRRLRRLQALGKDEDLPALESSGLTRREEARRWAELGLDKLSSRSSAQEFWLLVFRPLIDHLQQDEGSLLRACDDASQLVNVRYPDLWEHHPDRLRKRYAYRDRPRPPGRHS